MTQKRKRKTLKSKPFHSLRMLALLMLVASILSICSVVLQAAQAPIPCITGHFRRIYMPSHGRYLNDHTLIKGVADGRWHVYGITDESQGDPFQEQEFLHASAPSLYSAWTEHDDILRVNENNSVNVWAPHIIYSPNGVYSMFYYERFRDSTLNGLRVAVSANLHHFIRNPNPQIPGGGRDPMVYQPRINGRLQSIVYSVGVDQTPPSPRSALPPGYPAPVNEDPANLRHGQILASVSLSPESLDQWQSPYPVLTDPIPSFGWGNLESPFVVKYQDFYFLFVTRTDVARVGINNTEDPGRSPVLTNLNAPGQYMRTLVFRSRDPLDFSWTPVAAFRSHAAEVIEDNGRYFITSAGWTSQVGEARRGLSIAPLEFREEGTCPTLRNEHKLANPGRAGSAFILRK